ncbi:MAG: aquaporin [Clostridia bacterium]|nr:aquaporin [Clostridia bacterium]
MKKYFCEAIGTAVLVLFGCGTAVITGNTVAIALAFGLSIVAMAYVIGNVSGCHVNPAVSLAMLINKKITITEFLFYVLAQVIGAFVGAGILFFILSQSDAVAQAGGIEAIGLGTNGFGESSSLGISMWAALAVEVVLTFVFIYTIIGVTSDEKKSSVAGIVIGLTLAFVHILGIALTGTSVNPARSIAPATIMAIKGKTEAIKQVWVFIVAPFVGSAIAAFAYKFLNKEKEAK